jgi:hypothetical protein
MISHGAGAIEKSRKGRIMKNSDSLTPELNDSRNELLK